MREDRKELRFIRGARTRLHLDQIRPHGLAERLIASISRECLDHVVVFGERQLRHLLLSYMNYYNTVRTHLSLAKDAPVRALCTQWGAFSPGQSSMDYIINISGFDLW